MIFSPLPLLQLSYSNDKQFANALCRKEKKAINKFHEKYSKQLYYIARKFCNWGVKPQDALNYRIKTGYNINVTDCVSDTYLWLIKSIVFNKSCHNQGDHGASFEAYIITVLNSDFTKKDCMKSKPDYSLIKVIGVTGYVPRSIEKIGHPI